MGEGKLIHSLQGGGGKGEEKINGCGKCAQSWSAR